MDCRVKLTKYLCGVNYPKESINMYFQITVMFVMVLTLSTSAVAARLELIEAEPTQFIVPTASIKCTYIDDLVSCPVSTLQQGAILDGVALQNTNMLSSEPIYIGGARYQLTRNDFTAVIIQVPIPIPFGRKIKIPILVGYKASVPVYGDFGQDLYFDIFGNSGTKNMNLTAVCGSYSDSDVGPEYTMSQLKSTDGSCQRLDLMFTTSGAASSINLNVLISEKL